MVAEVALRASTVAEVAPGVLRDLRPFLAVARSGSIAEAARELERSSATVSRAISEMERILGVPLFERTSRGLVPTAAGTATLARGKRIETELRHAAQQVAVARSQADGVHVEPAPDWWYDARRLRLAIALTELRRVSLAADALGLTQAGASMALRRLEEGVGLELFERTAGGLLPTYAAVQVAAHGSRVEAELRHLVSDLASLGDCSGGSVVVGALPLGRTTVLPSAIAEVVAAHAGIRVTTVESHFEHLLDGLRSGSIDVLLSAARDADGLDGCVAEPLFEDRLALIAGAGHRLAGRESVRTDELLAERWVLPRATSSSRRLFEEALRAVGLVPPVPLVESADLAVVRHLVVADGAVAVVSARQFEVELGRGDLVELRTELPPMTRSVRLLRRAGTVTSPALDALLVALRRSAAATTTRSRA
ncbi:MAG: LysR family transcriptional regulator [Nocardioides sp.]|uniref:LysR family transcriptional regulator n=1 Tax=Nocardioides sp. TaxID=35761 RepID=UPI0039E57F59